MGKRYYCDYCDRSFKDDIEARKKHLSSMQHMKNQADHYSAFKDPETILEEERRKTPCKRYMTYGECAFGFSCRYSHYTEPMIMELQRLVAAKYFKGPAAPKNGWPNPDDIIEEYFENVEDSSDAGKLDYSIRSAPSDTSDYSNLPPSLRPVALDSACNFSEWGRTS